MSPARWASRWRVVGGPPALRPAAQRITAAVAQQVPVDDAAALELAIHELLANALEHGHLGDPSLPIDVEVAAVDGDSAIVRITDRAVAGRWSFPPPTATQAVGRAHRIDATRGRGLALVTAATAALRVVTAAGRTVVEIELPSCVSRPDGAR